MSATIDHLRVGYEVTVLREFTDTNGITLKAGDSGVITQLSFDQVRSTILIELQNASGKRALSFPLTATTGPRNGHMRDYFEMGEDATLPPTHRSANRPNDGKMIVPPARADAPPFVDDGLDKLRDVEAAMQKAYPHIGAAASIAEMYAQRMRMFQRAGNESRAAAAFKLAVDWMGTYASWATSGGEGMALSQERDDFHAALVREFGYDPTLRSL